MCSPFFREGSGPGRQSTEGQICQYLHILFGFGWGASVPSTCRRCLESLPMVEERRWGPPWVQLSWMRLGSADHRSEALKKCYKDGVSFPLALQSVPNSLTQINCSGSCSLFHFASCVLPATLAGHRGWRGEEWKATSPTVCVIVCSLWREGVRQGLESALWLLRPVLRLQGGLAPWERTWASVFRGWATGPVFKCWFCSWRESSFPTKTDM